MRELTLPLMGETLSNGLATIPLAYLELFGADRAESKRGPPAIDTCSRPAVVTVRPSSIELKFPIIRSALSTTAFNVESLFRGISSDLLR